MTASPSRPLPGMTAENAFFWRSGADGRLRFLTCPSCRYRVHPPGPVCPRCLTKGLRAEPVSGKGTVFAFTVNYHPWIVGFDPPYVIAMVELDEQAGLRLTTNIVGCGASDVSVGMPVEVVFEQHDDVWLPLFRPTT